MCHTGGFRQFFVGFQRVQCTVVSGLNAFIAWLFSRDVGSVHVAFGVWLVRVVRFRE